MLCEFAQGSSDLLNSYKISAIASFPSFPEMVYLSEGVFINYSDASEEMVIQPGLLGYLEREFDVCVSKSIQGTIVWEESRVCLAMEYDAARFQVEVETIEQLDHDGELDVVYLTKLRRTKHDMESTEKFRFELRLRE